MDRYRVRAGAVLPHQGEVLSAGAFVELPRHVAADVAVRDLVDPVDAGGQVITLPPYDAELEAHRPHERITILQNRMVAARDVVMRLEEEIAQAAPPPAVDEPSDSAPASATKKRSV